MLNLRDDGGRIDPLTAKANESAHAVMSAAARAPTGLGLGLAGSRDRSGGDAAHGGVRGHPPFLPDVGGGDWGHHLDGGAAAAAAAAAAEPELHELELLEARERDGRVSRRSRSGSSRRVAEGGRGVYESAQGARQEAPVAMRGEEGADVDEEGKLEELESFNLRVVYAKGRTGFQESKAFNWPEGSLVAGRYEVRWLGGVSFVGMLCACFRLFIYFAWSLVFVVF